MIELHTDQYTIHIIDESIYSIGSMDNVREYQKTHGNPEKHIAHHMAKYGVMLFRGDECLATALLVSEGGAYTSPQEGSAVVDGDRLTVILGDCIFCLSIPALTLHWMTRCENTATCFMLYRIEGGYILYGELSILKISNDGAVEWERFGPDIFVTQDGKDAFVLCADHIEATDWLGNTYRFGFDGVDLYVRERQQ